MPSGSIPTYPYVPSAKKTDPLLRTCSSLRARLFAGGTYFRSREPGLKSNLISVQVIEYGAPDGAEPEGVCVVTNLALKSDEMVAGPADVEFFDVQFDTFKRIEIDQLDTPLPRARVYSISFKIAPPPEPVVEFTNISVVKLLSLPGVLAALVTPPPSGFTPTDKIIINRRRRVYALVPITVTTIDPDTSVSTTETGWDIADLRAKINADDPWIEMLERSGPTDDGMGGPPIPNPNPADVQDSGVDADFLTPFAETRLSGGDGLPDNPDRESTGPTRSIVHVNYGEKYDGTLGEVNTVYEWNGRSSREGTWVSY